MQKLPLAQPPVPPARLSGKAYALYIEAYTLYLRTVAQQQPVKPSFAEAAKRALSVTSARRTTNDSQVSRVIAAAKPAMKEARRNILAMCPMIGDKPSTPVRAVQLPRTEPCAAHRYMGFFKGCVECSASETVDLGTFIGRKQTLLAYLKYTKSGNTLYTSLRARSVDLANSYYPIIRRVINRIRRDAAADVARARLTQFRTENDPIEVNNRRRDFARDLKVDEQSQRVRLYAAHLEKIREARRLERRARRKGRDASPDINPMMYSYY